MFKFKEKYVISSNYRDLGEVTILGIINKKNSKLRKRIHKNNRVYKVENISL